MTMAGIRAHKMFWTDVYSLFWKPVGKLLAAGSGGIVSWQETSFAVVPHSRPRARRKEPAQLQCSAEANLLEALDTLSRGEIERVVECLRDGSPAFLTYAHSASVKLLISKKLVRALEGNYHQDYHPFTFYLSAWKAIMKRKDEFLEKEAAIKSARMRHDQSQQ